MISAANIATTRAAGFLASTFIINVLACSRRFDPMHVFFQADLWQVTLSPEGKTHSAPLSIFLIRAADKDSDPFSHSGTWNQRLSAKLLRSNLQLLNCSNGPSWVEM